MSERRLYETTFIINAALEDNDIETVISKVAGYIENHGGQVQEINKWGRRRLAYPINKKYNGYYVHMIFDANSNTIPILERFMVLEDTVLRHLTLQLSTKLREFRVKRAAEQQERLARSLEEAAGQGIKIEPKQDVVQTEKEAVDA
ncbi:30S ribosomal protein S6 [Bacteroidetes/Chlorobi group bacterium ChocPot_Mid]|jgi:small subunit ribosomal protein S6|nr:MAG: 30S ribosomal protein S6 [Bacteroidetes/Chlorobi group bacterium ChocPot_Mid]